MPKVKLMRFQKRGVKRIEEFDGRCLLADEMGLGKTIQALWFLRRNKDTAFPAIVVCPATLKWNWQLEASRHLPGLHVEVLEGRRPPKRPVLAPLTIINYDILQAWLVPLLNLYPQTVIFDEAQYIKSASAKRTKAAEELCDDGIPYLLALTGTPITNRPVDLWVPLHLINKKWFPSYHEFGMRYCKAKHTRWGWQFRGGKNLKELNTKLNRLCMIRRRKAEVLKDLPPLTRSIVPLPIDTPREYRAAEVDFRKWLLKNKPKTARKTLKAQRLVKMGYLKRLAAELKMSSVIEWCEQFLENCDRKLLLYGIHKRTISQLKKRFAKLCVIVDGSTSSMDRQLAVRHFQSAKSCRLFIGNIEAAGVGLNLTAASDIAFFELSWVPADHTQVEARPHRIGQDQPVTAYYLIAKDTIESSLCEKLQQKQADISAALDGSSEIESLELFDLLEEEMRNA